MIGWLKNIAMENRNLQNGRSEYNQRRYTEDILIQHIKYALCDINLSKVLITFIPYKRNVWP